MFDMLCLVQQVMFIDLCILLRDPGAAMSQHESYSFYPNIAIQQTVLANILRLA